MSLFKELSSEFTSRRDVIRNAEATRTRKCFALLEIVCFPLSFASILALLLQFALALAGYGDYVPEVWIRYVSPVLLAGAVGYLTNWLAIMMLFRPYNRKRWLFFWPQGMIPRNKAAIAAKLGDAVGNGLLSPDRIADELRMQAVSFLRRPDVIVSIKEQFQSFFANHQEKVIRFLVPEVQHTILNAVDGMITSGKVRDFWNDVVQPYLTDEENCRKIAGTIVDLIRQNSSGLTDQIRDRLRAHLEKKIDGIPLINIFSEDIAKWVIAFFADRESMQKMLADWLGDSQFRAMLEGNVVKIGDKANAWINSVQSDEQIDAFTERSKEGLKKMISAYLRQAFPEIVKSAIESEKLWLWIENTALPRLGEMLSDFIARHKDDIVGYLKLSQRINDAINEQDVRQFHGMINSITAEHLGAIQVLGFILGAMIGGVQLVLTILLG